MASKSRLGCWPGQAASAWTREHPVISKGFSHSSARPSLLLRKAAEPTAGPPCIMHWACTQAMQVSHKQHSHPAVPVAGSEQVLQGPLCSTSTLAHLAMQGLP